MKTGRVYLVGAGPGDPGLITVKGLECLRQADIVVYDHLVDEKLLDAAPAAERVYVGKTAGEHTRPQEEINRLLAELGKQGKTVVRLKGGDPFVLGRGGEEAEVLKKSGVPFEIVPGITSAVAVPAYAGIPVTHRRLASSFAVITGHEDPAKAGSSINWEKLATGADTLVFLMGMQNLSKIAARLVENGRPAQTPVAVIADGTSPQQRTVVGTLADIAEKAEQGGIRPPAVVVVGEVVRLREQLRWFDDRPLFGKRVLVTRSRQQASALSRLLARRGARPVELPAIDIRAAEDTAGLDRAIARLRDYHWVVFTSTNGVAAFFQRLRSLKQDSRALGGLTIGAIGPATAAALAQQGIQADFIPAVYTGADIIKELGNYGVAGKRFLLPRADIADKELSEGIARLGAAVDEVAAYHTVPAAGAISRAREMLLAGEIDIITFTSSSTVTSLLTAFEDKAPALEGVRVACIGPKTAETAARAGLRVDIIATEHTIPGLVASIEDYFSKERLL